MGGIKYTVVINKTFSSVQMFIEKERAKIVYKTFQSEEESPPETLRGDGTHRRPALFGYHGREHKIKVIKKELRGLN
jgi:hypothetical protein